MTNWDKRFLELAKLVSTWSKDPSTKVGAVITDQKNRIISVGYNGFARGIEDDNFRLYTREIKYKLVLHAEENALDFANKDVSGCKMYTYPMMPCSKCASRIIQNEISEVISIKASDDVMKRWSESFELTKEIFREADIKITLLDINL